MTPTCVRCGIRVLNHGSSCRDCSAADPHVTRLMVDAAKADLRRVKARGVAIVHRAAPGVKA